MGKSNPPQAPALIPALVWGTQGESAGLGPTQHHRASLGTASRPPLRPKGDFPSSPRCSSLSFHPAEGKGHPWTTAGPSPGAPSRALGSP